MPFHPLPAHFQAPYQIVTVSCTNATPVQCNQPMDIFKKGFKKGMYVQTVFSFDGPSPTLQPHQFTYFWCRCTLWFASPNRDRSHKSIPLKLKWWWPNGAQQCDSNFSTSSHRPFSLSIWTYMVGLTHASFYLLLSLAEANYESFWPMCTCIILLPGFYLLPFLRAIN